ncbi:MAG: menaquinone biosynthesis protein [Bacteroidetes bacterium]|nr:menaquinone biosynthesis protein [Bacteroidota bacterium]
MHPARISAVSYLNTIPFVYGIQSSGNSGDFNLSLDVPSLCAEKLRDHEVDIALVPAGAIPEMKDANIIPGYCIGAVSKVRTVLLLSRKPLEEIRTIHLDFDSKTSVRLVKVLASKFWKINPGWVELGQGMAEHPESIDSLVAIGDKTFDLVNNFPYVYDLAEEWIRYTELPFVFAVWMARKDVPAEVIDKLNAALEFGITHRQDAVANFQSKIPAGIDALEYLTKNISFELDARKQNGLDLFLSYLQEMNL